MVSNTFATSSIWAAHFSPHRDDPAARDPVSKTGGMTVRLCPSLRAPPPGERARALTTPQREHHAQQAGTRTQRHALVTACHSGVSRLGPGHPRKRGCSSDGRALRSHRRGRGFKPRQFHLRQRMVSRGRVEAVPVIWLLVVRLHDRPGCLGADRLASTHSPSCPSTLGDGSYGSGRALQALTSRFDSGLLHRVRGRR